MTAVIAALIGVLVGGYLNNFIGEDYRRFRDGTALAGALAGELAAHATAIPDLIRLLRSLLEAVDSGRAIILRSNESSVVLDPIFDSNTAKIGLLGSELAEEVAYIYEQIRAYRMAYRGMCRYFGEMEVQELRSRIDLCLRLVEGNADRGAELISSLRAFAGRPYRLWHRSGVRDLVS